MFAYYALRCWESKHFWTSLSRDSHYWALFKHFVLQMNEIAQSPERRPARVDRFRL